MSVLSNGKHEQFAMAIAKGVSLAEAYTSAGYSECGAKQSAARLLRKADIRSRVAQIQAELSAGTIALEISSRNARVQALQHRWDRMCRVIEQWLLLRTSPRSLSQPPQPRRNPRKVRSPFPPENTTCAVCTSHSGQVCSHSPCFFSRSC
jgi:hypothetical protein